MNRLTHILRATLLIFAAVLVAGGLAGCDSGGSNGEDTPTAQVRFLHASPDAGSVTVAANGDEIASDLTFSQDLTSPTTTEYKEVPIEGTVEVQNANGDALATVDATTLEGDRQYTVVVAGGVAAGENAGQDAPQAFVLRDDLPELGDGEIGLRVLHGSVALPPIDVFLVPPGGSPGSDNRQASGLSFSGTWPASPTGSFQVASIPDEGRVLTIPTSEGPLELPVATAGTSLPTGRHATVIVFDRAPDAEFPWAAMVRVD